MEPGQKNRYGTLQKRTMEQYTSYIFTSIMIQHVEYNGMLTLSTIFRNHRAPECSLWFFQLFNNCQGSRQTYGNVQMDEKSVVFHSLIISQAQMHPKQTQKQVHGQLLFFSALSHITNQLDVNRPEPSDKLQSTEINPMLQVLFNTVSWVSTQCWLQSHQRHIYTHAEKKKAFNIKMVLIWGEAVCLF